MSGINRVILIGVIDDDLKVSQANDGSTIVSITLATKEAWNDKSSGERQERIELHRIKMFGRVAEIAEQYLQKNSQIYIQGKVQTRKYKDSSDAEQYITEVVVSGFDGVLQMLDKRQPKSDKQAVSIESSTVDSSFDEDKIPF